MSSPAHITLAVEAPRGAGVSFWLSLYVFPPRAHRLLPRPPSLPARWVVPLPVIPHPKSARDAAKAPYQRCGRPCVPGQLWTPPRPCQIWPRDPEGRAAVPHGPRPALMRTASRHEVPPPVAAPPRVAGSLRRPESATGASLEGRGAKRDATTPDPATAADAAAPEPCCSATGRSCTSSPISRSSSSKFVLLHGIAPKRKTCLPNCQSAGSGMNLLGELHDARCTRGAGQLRIGYCPRWRASLGKTHLACGATHV